MNNKGFYHIVGLDSYSERQGPPYPWSIDVNLPEAMHERLIRGQRIEWDVMPKIGIANRATGWTDFAATNLNTIVVSERAKAFFEESAKGDIQFIHLRIRTKAGRRIGTPTFWVANCLHLLDCVDKRRSATDLVCGDTVYKWIYVAPSKVPKSVNVFRCLGNPERLQVRGRLGNAITTSGLTGAEFFSNGRPGEETVD